MFRRMKAYIEKAGKRFNFKIFECFNFVFKGVPGAPRDVQLTVTSSHTLNVKFIEPDLNNGAVVTRYKGECCVWSCDYQVTIV